MNNSASGQVPLFNRLRYPVLFGVAVLAGAFQVPPGAAQVKTSSVATSQDCLEFVLQASDDPSLTREERIAKLDRALLAALNQSDLCQSAGVANGDKAGEGMSGAVAGGSPGEKGDSALESVPAGDIRGDAPADQTVDAQNTAKSQASAVINANPANESGPEVDVASNGKPPEDIPPAENDDIIAKQLRQAAMQETDPETKAKLWNEYRRYKNLPVQAAPEPGATP